MLFDEDMIFVQGVSSDVVTLQIMQMHVSSSRNHLFCRADGYTTLVHLFAGHDIASGNFMADSDSFREPDFTSIENFTVPGPDWCDDNQGVIIAVDSQ